MKKFTPQQMQDEAYCWQDQFSLGEMGYGKATDFDWFQADHFPVGKLSGSQEEWEKWWNEELTSNERKPYLEALANWWIIAADEHLVVVEGLDGQFYVWEGNHRTAISKIHNMQFVPVFLGLRKNND